MTNYAHRCIFCGEAAKMTSEHIWGEWIQEHVPRTSNKHSFADVFVAKPGEDEPTAVRIRAGDPINSQVSVVCGECNNGWMSRLQERAKPFLIPLFAGIPEILTDASQRAIAAWASMATMTGEHITRNPQRITVPQADRDCLMRNGTAPLGTWRIWIGRCSSEWEGQQWVRITAPILDAANLEKAVAADERRPNTQTTAFKIGKLYVATMNCPFPEITQGWDWRTAPRALNRLQQVWPIARHIVAWPNADMTGKDAKVFATAWKAYSDSLAKRVGYR
jgi:hypothetical protein